MEKDKQIIFNFISTHSSQMTSNDIIYVYLLLYCGMTEKKVTIK